MVTIIEEAAPPRGFFMPGKSKLYLRPLGLLSDEDAVKAVSAGEAAPVAVPDLAATRFEILIRTDDKIHISQTSLGALNDWAEREGAGQHVNALLDRMGGDPAGRPAMIMGVVNVTPDSFSDGGDSFAAEDAISHGRQLLAEGADILDIGGESTRPGAAPVSIEEEIRRVIPVVEALAADGAVVSVDTRNAAVMRVALQAGARTINDVSALCHDPESLSVVANSTCDIVLMHMQGDPGTMQDAPVYDFAPLDVYDYLEERIAVCENAGIERSRIIVDPGIGFGKTDDHNLAILSRLTLFHGLGVRLLIGVSRKSLIGRLSRGEAPKDRMPGSLAIGLDAIQKGAHILRVHDVAETRQAMILQRAVR